jgi:SAM-dependent methyltransferase
MSVGETQEMFGCRTEAAAWSAFWVDADADGCTAAFPPIARRSIDGRWRALISGAAPARHLLDIACGRGAVLMLAASTGMAGRLTGVDRATIPPGKGGLDIRSGIDAADLPFPDASFDIVTSQFGVEYAGLDAALAEAARVCGGALLVLTHAADGVVCRQMREQADQIGALLDDSKFRESLIAGDAESVRRAIDAMLPLQENVSLLQAVRQAVVALDQQRRHLPPPAFADEVDALSGGLAEHRARMAMLIDAAPDRAAIARAVSALDASGFAATTEEERSGDDVVGRWIIARRRASRDNSGG